MLVVILSSIVHGWMEFKKCLQHTDISEHIWKKLVGATWWFEGKILYCGSDSEGILDPLFVNAVSMNILVLIANFLSHFISLMFWVKMLFRIQRKKLIFGLVIQFIFTNYKLPPSWRKLDEFFSFFKKDFVLM